MTSGKIRLLHIEKDSSDRLLLKLALSAGRGHEYELFEAQDGFSGIVTAREARPDIILLDVLLPGMDGYEVVARLKGIPALREVPIVALTGAAGPGARELALAAGCVGFISKPPNMRTLAHQLRKFLDGYKETISPEEEGRYLRELVAHLGERLETRFVELRQAHAGIGESGRLAAKIVALVSHELRTPLTIIQGYLGILLDAAAEERHISSSESAGITRGLDKGVQRLSDVINEILDAARLEAGEFRPHFSHMAVTEILRSVAADLRLPLDERRQTLTIEPSPDLPRLWIDSKRMYQVFMNVVGNAIKFTPDGGEIRVKATRTPAEFLPPLAGFVPLATEYVNVIVEDTGVGIAEVDLERIFGGFYEVRDGAFHSTSKYQFLGGGIGLGLSIARGITEKHGGWLWAESSGCDLDACPGSRFHILIPVRSARNLQPGY